MDPDLQKDMQDYAWKYFAYHADQRIKSFNFFLLFLTAGIAGLLAHSEHFAKPMFSFVGGLILGLLAFLFWKLDRRHRTLVHVAENALMTFEDQLALADGASWRLKIFNVAAVETEELKKHSVWPIKYLTCTDCFNIMFFVVGLLAAGGIFRGVFLLFNH
jgi:hypothetical protein